MGRIRVAIITVFALLAVLPAQAFAAKMIARNAKHITLKVRKLDGQQVALVTYSAQGSTHHVLLWGARNATPHPDIGPAQLFKINYSGGFGTPFKVGAWKKIANGNQCLPYKGRGPKIHMAVRACAMPDGSFWALQSWMGSELPDNGWKPKDGHADAELWASHWNTALPKFWLKADWIYGDRYDHLYGQLTYQGTPVYGGSSTGRGSPTDSYGRLVTIDTLDPPWAGGYRQAGGWYRYNSFLVHHPEGDFCDGVYKHIAGIKDRSVPGRGKMYRATVNGPGVTPVLYWEGPPPGHYRTGLNPVDLLPPSLGRTPFDRPLDDALNQEQIQIDKNTGSCSHTH